MPVNLGGVRRGDEYDQNLLYEMFKELKNNEKKKSKTNQMQTINYKELGKSSSSLTKAMQAHDPMKSHLSQRSL